MSVYSVSVYPSSVTIRKGEWYYGAYATVRASSNCCTDVTWYSDKTAVATVNATTHIIIHIVYITISLFLTLYSFGNCTFIFFLLLCLFFIVP